MLIVKILFISILTLFFARVCTRLVKNLSKKIDLFFKDKPKSKERANSIFSIDKEELEVIAIVIITLWGIYFAIKTGLIPKFVANDTIKIECGYWDKLKDECVRIKKDDIYREVKIPLQMGDRDYKKCVAIFAEAETECHLEDDYVRVLMPTKKLFKHKYSVINIEAKAYIDSDIYEENQAMYYIDIKKTDKTIVK